MSTPSELLINALQQHQAGDLRLAQAMYRAVLERDPRQADALHLLGMLLHQAGDSDRALQLIRDALQVQPDNAQFHNNLATVLESQGCLAEAAAHFREAARQVPDYAEAHYNLGNVLTKQQLRMEATTAYRQALVLRPAFWEASNNLGLALLALKRLGEARDVYREALARTPDRAVLHLNLGSVFLELLALPEARHHFEQALRLHPDFAEAHANLAAILQRLGRAEEARAHSQQAVRLRPADAEAHYKLGHLLASQGDPDGARASYEQALRLQPDYAEAHVNLGNLLHAQRQGAAAADHFRAALRLKPDLYEAEGNLGNALLEQGDIVAARSAYQRALHLRPDWASAHNGQGLAHGLEGELAAALAHFRESLRLQPDAADVRSNLLFYLCHDPRITAEQLYAEHCQWGVIHGRAPSRNHDNDRTARRLRIGYVSADFRAHAAAPFIESFLIGHDRAQVDVFCYADVPRPDETTERLRAHAPHWRPVAGWSDQALVDQVRADSIDLLVDLSGHTRGNRLTAFALRPAPVQVTYLGYPHTTGLEAMDYRLTDAVLDPPGEPSWCTEAVIRLPEGVACFTPPTDAPPVGPLPAQRTGRFTFGCLHKLVKLNDDVLDVWCRVLRALPAARMLILRNTLREPVQAQLLRRFTERGIDAQRLELRQAVPQPRGGYLHHYGEIDFALDTSPWSGHTTACESLWMGVPLLTRYGGRQAGRMAASVLTAVELPEFIAGTRDEFVTRAVQWAQDRDRLARLRAELRERLRGSRLCDAARFARTLEAAYRQMWQRWCSGR
jgi:predicted O-linked N-acetylglucosamine transferase (SPINDLY family)